MQAKTVAFDAIILLPAVTTTGAELGGSRGAQSPLTGWDKTPPQPVTPGSYYTSNAPVFMNPMLDALRSICRAPSARWWPPLSETHQ